MSENYNLFYFFRQFPDEDACRKYLEKRRWGNAPVCPHCGNSQKISLNLYKEYTLLKSRELEELPHFRVTSWQPF